MAYLRPILIPCVEPGCASPATHTLYRKYSAWLGTYCAHHGEAACAAETQREQAQLAAYQQWRASAPAERRRYA